MTPSSGTGSRVWAFSAGERTRDALRGRMSSVRAVPLVSQNPEERNQISLESVVDQYHQVADEFSRGMPDPSRELFSRRDDVTLANPFGPAAREWDQVARALDVASSGFSEARSAALRASPGMRVMSWRRDGEETLHDCRSNPPGAIDEAISDEQLRQLARSRQARYVVGVPVVVQLPPQLRDRDLEAWGRPTSGRPLARMSETFLAAPTAARLRAARRALAGLDPGCPRRTPGGGSRRRRPFPPPVRGRR